eukprot:15468224-Alexandrium_andersonii.AAC.2
MSIRAPLFRTAPRCFRNTPHRLSNPSDLSHRSQGWRLTRTAGIARPVATVRAQGSACAASA